MVLEQEFLFEDYHAKREFNQINCGNKDFLELFDCNNSKECFQVEVSDPWGDYAIITLTFINGELKKLVYLAISDFKSKPIAKQQIEEHLLSDYYASNALQDSLFAVYSVESVIIDFPTPQIDLFFTEKLWLLPKKNFLDDWLRDATVWTIKGRYKGAESKWIRCCFNTDSDFYREMKNVIDILPSLEKD
jgi:hypothetical protein